MSPLGVHPLVVPGILAWAASWAMAGLVHAKGRGSLQSRLLAALLVLEGAAVGATFSLAVAARDPTVAFAARGIEFSAELALCPLYLAFLGTVPSPLSRPFRGRLARVALLAAAAAAFALWPLAAPVLLADGLVALGGGAGPWHDVGAWLRPSRPAAKLVDVTWAGVLLFGLVVALDALRRAPPASAARSRAKHYALAFGVREAAMASGLLVSATGALVPWPTWTSYYLWLAITLGLLVFVLLLGYGILRGHLFDIDLRIKWTVRRSTLVAAFVAMFFVASESAAAFLGDRWGTYAGILAAGLLLFALAPLQRLADRVGDAAMPHVRDTEAYRLVRKREVYEAALAEALADGTLSDKDRNVLAALADHLGLGAQETLAIERELAAGGRRPR